MVMKQIGGGGNPYSAAARIKDTCVKDVSEDIELKLKPIFYRK